MPTNKPNTVPNTNAAWYSDLMYTDDISVQYKRALVYGAMGSGKTRFALTWPDPFVIDVDNGLLTGRKLHVPYKKISPPKDRRDRKKVFQLVIDILSDAKDRTGPFAPGGPLADRKTIVLDGYTALADSLMKEILLSDGLDFLNDKPQYDHWNFLAARLDNITKLAQEVPFNFVATCGTKTEKDEQSGSWLGLPDIIGGYRNDIGYQYDEVYYFETRRARQNDVTQPGKDLTYEAHTAKFRIFDAKSRLDIPNSTIQNPTYDLLLTFDAKEKKT